MLARALHEVLRHKVSIDVAFKRACGGECASSVEERESLYEQVRQLLLSYQKLKCVSKKTRPRELVRLWLSGYPEPESAPCRLSVPAWMYEKMFSLIGEEVEALFRAMEKRTIWLRVNEMKTSVERAVRELEQEGAEIQVSKEYPYMLKVISAPKPIRLLEAVRKYHVIPHDIASAAVVEALKPEPGDSILDACAAPGIKTSLIAALGERRVKITAIDVSGRRLESMKMLMRRLGVPGDIVRYVRADARRVSLSESYDKALIDAPCSNSGAMSKDPGLRITLTPGKIDHYSSLQHEIVRNISRYADEMIFATCSIMPEEGEVVVERIMKSMGVELQRPGVPLCSDGYGAYEVANRVCRLYPHRTESEGFFISRLIKTRG